MRSGAIRFFLPLAALAAALWAPAAARAECEGLFPNGVLEAGEECDDGNTVLGDGCGEICLIERCGNAWLDPGEFCDDAGFSGCCEINCQCPRCGDGIVHNTPCASPVSIGCVDFVREQCDDGNTVSGDGCSKTCAIEAASIECCVDQDGDSWPDLAVVTDPAICVSGPITGSHTQYLPCGTGGALVARDCDDGNSAVHPGATEIPGNAVDENCNGFVSCGAAEGGRPAWASSAAALAALGIALAVLRRRTRREG